MVFDKLHHLFIDILRFLPDFVVQVRAIKRGNENLRLVHAEVLLDVALHLGRGRGRQRNHRHFLAYLVNDGADAAVFRTEVVSPFRDTVCLIDGVKGDVDILEEFHVLLLGQRLRSHIQQLRLAGDKVLLHFVDFHFRQRGVQEVCNAHVRAEVANGIHLVLHQGDQRGDDDGRAILHQGRQLIA